MSSNVLRLLDEALKLPDADRTDMALRLLDSIGEPVDEVVQTWITEAKKRLTEIQRGDVETVPWADARKRIFAR